MSGKFCKDCRWCSGPTEVDEFIFSRCFHPKELLRSGPDPVSGESIEKRAYCEIARMGIGNCGPDGQYWEPKSAEDSLEAGNGW